MDSLKLEREVSDRLSVLIENLERENRDLREHIARLYLIGVGITLAAATWWVSSVGP